ncbi:uncharacterized protein F5891DRAFT_1013568 [Suillus fuscotomentosus]|uniref:Uncharacterized protein n=1 Tax=Suillus fuscotomentosus TaxID=1912939 RepID=A0AAD4EFV8_9AGAM|nr:uncharacterized protein F5891DRAFT_1013568 [Suillus fuscotomentosus]KAG1904249.1 hypothetical protein F5891DRAFT_1013568 [Suillus fuscotomentosus]
MSLSFGGLGLISLWTPLYFWDDSARVRSEFRSFVFLLVFVAVVLILAYLTNPSETSFRAYLTEQSFRQHLSHLDDTADESSDTDAQYSSRPVDRNTLTDRTPLPFHFANRASVSLRTPKHIFHSIGICTIATTRGAAGVTGRSSSTTSLHGNGNLSGVYHDGSVVSDSWFIGAFGHWWRGGLVDSWYHDAMIGSKDAEGWSSGILGFKALDKLNEFNSRPFAKSVPCPRLPSRGTPPRLRNRERFAPRLGLIPRRNSTPPPLPKSASLPLHTDHRTHEHNLQISQPVSDQTCIGVYVPPVAQTISCGPSRSVSIDDSPMVAEVLKQIAAQQAFVAELDTQICEVQTAATTSHDALEAELAELRIRKRDEDQRKAEGKARAKMLEDARRSAETGRRDAEKKLKAARGVKEGAVRRIEELESEIGRLRDQIETDRATLLEEAEVEDANLTQELELELETKKKEVRIAEDVVAALNTRAKELEVKITEARERLEATRERTEVLKQEPLFVPMQVLNSGHSSTQEHYGHINGHGIANDYDMGQADAPSWSSTFSPFDEPLDIHSSPGSSEREQSGLDSGEFSRSPRPPRLSLGSLSNFSPNASETSAVSRRSKGYTIFDDDIASLAQPSQSGKIAHGHFSPQTNLAFSPFDVQTPSSAFIPSSLISVLDSPSGDCRGIGRAGNALSVSPVSLTGPSPAQEMNVEYDPFEVRHHTQAMYDKMSMPHRTNSDPSAVRALDNTLVNDAAIMELDSGPRRWFSTSAKDKQRKGLNPDAKVFRLPRRQAPAMSEPIRAAPMACYDALNPNGLMSSNSSTPSALLRAFAPSRAEREVLQRALGGSTNTSLERLPSLSDVGSIPSSPVHVHAEVQPLPAFGGKGAVLPAWLQSLPLIRKPNFSPWEDEEPVSASTGGEAKRK